MATDQSAPKSSQLVIALGLVFMLSAIWVVAEQPTQAALPVLTADAQVVPVAGPVQFVLQQGVDGYEGCSDAHISAWDPDENATGDAVLRLRAGDVFSFLIHFDVSSLPRGLGVTRATIELFATEVTGPHALHTEAYEVLRPWKARAATWNSATESVLWGAPGCNKAWTDRKGYAVDEGLLEDRRTWHSVAVTQLAFEWMTNPETNYGIIVKGSPGTQVEYGIASSEHPILEWRPRLVVDGYLSQVATPTSTGSPTHAATPTATRTPDLSATFLPLVIR